MHNEEFFSNRLSELRNLRGVSAREMSLDIGQNPGYINSIENGKSLPSMQMFFYICDYLDISPHDFFDYGNRLPVEQKEIIRNLKRISPQHVKNIANIIEGLIH